MPPHIWDQCRETVVLCYKHQWWGLGSMCPGCRPMTKQVKLTPAAYSADPYYEGSDD